MWLAQGNRQRLRDRDFPAKRRNLCEFCAKAISRLAQNPVIRLWSSRMQLH
jgi:hypothetical protein